MQLDSEYLRRLRHTASHILAMAVLRLWPDTKLAIGPAIDEGFYYDFEFSTPISAEDLERLEEEMYKIIEADMPVYQIFKTPEEAKDFYTKWDQPYKRALLQDIRDEKISFYVIGDEESGFVDLCKGPHVERTGEVKAIKLLNIAGAYWRGDENNPMLTRIYGTAFGSKEELEEYLKILELRRSNDHRELNKRLKYYLIEPDYIGSGLPVLLPRGAYIRRKLEEWVLGLYQKTGHKLIYTPHVAKEKLWLTSGHLPYYKDDMFPPMQSKDGDTYYVKAMNCPMHIQTYKKLVRSYRDLPFRVTDMATVYRYEKTGELNGLTRVRSLTQDDGHLFCTEDQLGKEIESLLRLAFEIYSTLGFKDIRVDLSLRDPNNKDKYLGDDALWQKAEQHLKEALERLDILYTPMEGEAAFYGPKVDFHVTDVLGRSWQLATIQVDFNLPRRFKLSYIDKDGKEQVPVMIHRAFLGSFERFMGILIENFGGNLPLWLEYEKVRILPINEDMRGYAEQLHEVFRIEGIEATVDTKDEPLGAKIRRAEQDRVPYVAVVGKKEKDTGTVSLRVRGHGDIGLVKPDELVLKLKEEITRKMVRSIFLQ